MSASAYGAEASKALINPALAQLQMSSQHKGVVEVKCEVLFLENIYQLPTFY